MVIRKPKQGDIIKINLSPTRGHEQSGFRPALIINNFSFSQVSNMVLICPITSTYRESPLHVPLEGMATTGFIMCDQIKAVDLKNRKYTIVEAICDDILWEVSDIISGSIAIEDAL
ncbi:MAG: type II toxin-antitoxin system PemK/MazF family toxin [Defluviitaleaceae bacterium]|nr:type II toxin-antitoxin system PemK/MazF family toxin [Defluviitaleaceae bacterium]